MSLCGAEHDCCECGDREVCDIWVEAQIEYFEVG